MNSKKYEVNGKTGSESSSTSNLIPSTVNSKPPKSRAITIGSHSPTIRYSNSASPIISITSSHADNISRSSSPVTSHSSFENLLGTQDTLHRNLSDDSKSRNRSPKPSIYSSSALFRNLSDDLCHNYSNSSKPPKPGISSIRKIFKKQTEQLLPSAEHFARQMSKEKKEKKDNSTFYLNEGDSLGSTVGFSTTVFKPFNQGKINHSISMNLDSNQNKIEDDDILKRTSSINKDLNQKLNFITSEERIELQERGRKKLEERLFLKTKTRDSYRQEIEELNCSLVNKNVRVRSTLEIEKLRTEIRNLTNEKANLELKYSNQSNWTCEKCTFINLPDSYICSVCESDRTDDEVLICELCGQKNSLSSLSCINCNQYFNVEQPIVYSRESQSSNSLSTPNHNNVNPTNLNRNISNNSNGSNSSLNNSSQNTSANNIHTASNSPLIMPVQPSIPFIPSKNKTKL